MSKPHAELTPFLQATEEAIDIWGNPGAAAAREEYWDTGDTPESGFAEALDTYLMEKYGLTPEQAVKACTFGLWEASPEFIDKATRVLEFLEGQNE